VSYLFVVFIDEQLVVFVREVFVLFILLPVYYLLCVIKQ
jgi:hypothetical protein